MILDQDLYQPNKFDSKQEHLNLFDITCLEIEADTKCASKAVRAVLEHFNLTVKDVHQELDNVHMHLGEKWEDATDEIIDVSFLFNFACDEDD
jgi:hypothetical protein